MSEQLVNFLIETAGDPDKLTRFFANPQGEGEKAGLSPEETAVLIRRDPVAIDRLVEASKKGIIRTLKGKKIIKTLKTGKKGGKKR